MISLNSIEQAFGTCFKTVECDERVNRVMDCAVLHGYEEGVDGQRIAFFIMRKSIPGAPCGTVLTLAQLHELLFHP